MQADSAHPESRTSTVFLKGFPERVWVPLLYDGLRSERSTVFGEVMTGRLIQVFCEICVAADRGVK